MKSCIAEKQCKVRKSAGYQTAQGVGILEISDIDQGGRHRFFGSDLLFIRGVNQLFFNFLIFIMGGNQLFFPFFTFSTGFLLYRNQVFSIEFFVIDRLLASNASFQSNKQAMFYACLFFNFSYCCVLLIFANFYANELLEPASLKTCVRLSNEYVLNTNTIVYGLMVEYALHKI